jgi:hypothetical protein
MFVILKPEMKRCLGDLDPYLSQEGFKVESRHNITDWRALAEELYKPQIVGDPSFTPELNAYLWLTNSLFGNYGGLLRLSSQGGEDQNLRKLDALKRRFRRDISAKLDLPLRIFLDLRSIFPHQFTQGGKEGTLTIGSESLGTDFEGRWDHFFFKYIHVPDPNLETYRREAELLQDHGLVSKPVEEAQWTQMVRLGTLNPLQNQGVKNGRI